MKLPRLSIISVMWIVVIALPSSVADQVIERLTPALGIVRIGPTADKRPATRQEELMKKNALKITMLTLALVGCLAGASLCADEGWVPLFDGKTLDRWKVNGGTASYKVEDGVIVGTTVEGSPNTFLCKGDYKDFVLELDVKCDPRLNSGVQVRSHVYEKDDANPVNSKRAGVVYGPQCEIARKETGTAGRFYDEGRRGKWLAEIKPEAKDAFRDDDWNHYKIVVQGNRYRSWINGVACLRLHRRRGHWWLHRSPSPRHRQGRRAISGPLAGGANQGIEAGRGSVIRRHREEEKESPEARPATRRGGGKKSPPCSR